MIELGAGVKVYLAAGATDMRKSINGLAVLVSEVLEADPFSSQLFVFCNRGRDKVKILQWDNSGFWLHYKRLEKGRFKWPQAAPGTCLALSVRELRWLLDGLQLEQVGHQAHRSLHYTAVA